MATVLMVMVDGIFTTRHTGTSFSGGAANAIRNRGEQNDG